MGVGSVVVVFVEPCWQGGSAGGFVEVEAGEGPADGEGEVEAFDLAVGLGSVGPGVFRGDAESGADVASQIAAVSPRRVSDYEIAAGAHVSTSGRVRVSSRSCCRVRRPR
jgi:hypothetical protein